MVRKIAALAFAALMFNSSCDRPSVTSEGSRKDSPTSHPVVPHPIASESKPVHPIKPESPKPDSITATELMQAFRDDEHAATARYLGKELMVPGQLVERRDYSNSKSLELNLKTDDPRTIMCIFEADSDAFKQAKIGNKITVIGICDGLNLPGDIWLRNCSVR